MDRGCPQIDVKVQSFGAQKPIADNGKLDGRQRNRRVEIKQVCQGPAFAPTNLSR
jgi:hypothetical protein